MKERTDYYFERLNNSNFVHFVKLYNDVFGTNKNLSELEAKYDTAYIIEDYWAYLAFDAQSKEVAASYSVIPWVFVDNEQQILAAQSADTMTGNAHRGKGLFGVLHGKVVDLLVLNGFKFIFGFPNQNSFPVFKNKLNWKFYSKLNLYTIPTNNKIPIRKAFYKFSFLRPLHNVLVNRVFDKYKFDPSNYFMEDKRHIRTQYNDLFLKHKRADEHKILKIDNSIFYIKITNRLLIGDFKSTVEEFEKCLLVLIELASKCGITAIDFMCSPEMEVDAIFSTYHKPQESLRIGFFELNKSTNNYTKIKFTLMDLDTF